MPHEKSQYKRREFLFRMGATAALGLLSTTPLRSFARMEKERAPLAVDPMTAITIAKTSLDVISAFSGSKDSAMAAMMRYQIALLRNIIDQLSLVQSKLVEIQNAVSELPEQFRLSLEQQFKIELIAEVQAAAQRYATNVLAPSLINPSIIQNQEVRNEINNIIFIADQKISALALMEGGIGPQACMIAPLAMSLNIACRTSLNYPREVIVSSLIRYQNWFDDMLSTKRGSISDTLGEAARKHDSLLGTLDEDRLAQRLQLKNFKLDGSQKATAVPDPGIIFHVFGPNQIEGMAIDSYGGTLQGQNLTQTARALYRVNSNLHTYNEPQLGGLLIGYKRSPAKIRSKDEQFNWENPAPKAGDYYYIQKVDTRGNYSFIRLADMVNNGQTAARVDDVSRARINLKIAEANLERARMCFCAQANIVAINSRKRIKEYLNLIS